MTEPQTVPCPLRAGARQQPGAPALITPGGTRSYAALDRAVDHAARQLRAGGIEEECCVALHLPRGEACLVLLWALLRLGAVACPLSTRLPAAALAPMLRAVEAKRLLAADPKALEEALPDVAVEDAAALVRFDVEDAGARSGPGASWPLPLDRLATAIFTSGSTGAPKAALHSYGNHHFSAAGSNKNIELRPGDRWLLSLPLYHVGGLAITFRCWLARAVVALPATGEPLGAALVRCRATHASLVPTQLRRLLRENERENKQCEGAKREEASALERLRAVLLGGAAVPAALLDEAHDRGLPVHTSYGLTEMASQVTTTPPDASREDLRTAGHLLPHRRLRIAEDGELLVAGETLFAGYLQHGLVRRLQDADGWFHTGDLGALDARGRLRVTGRKDHLFISGGENIQPEEIERALGQLHGVVQAVVVPVPDAEFGQRPVAFVRGARGGSVLGGLAEQLEEVLPRFKIPDAFYPWPEEPEKGMKTDRAALRARARALCGSP